MTTLPGWVDYENAEHAAAVMSRGLGGVSASWASLLAVAQGVLSARADLAPDRLTDDYAFNEWRDLIAAARVLDLAAGEMALPEEDERLAAAILAACAFGMSGTFVSASAVIQSHGLLDRELSSGERTALALSAPALARDIFPLLTSDSPYRRCIEAVVTFLSYGNDQSGRVAVSALNDVIAAERESWESYLLRLSRLSLAHIHRLSTARVLAPSAHHFAVGFLDRLVADSPVLLPSQYDAVRQRGVLDGGNLLVTLPTGTGKTLLGELALLSSLGRSSGLACYIAPYVALGRQVAEKLQRHTPPSVRVHRLMGGYREPEPLDPAVYSEIVVATPERFDAMIRLQPTLIAETRCVVFDEAHIIGNGERGIRVEGMLTRLRLASVRGGKVPRFVLLSAVLSNSDDLASWIGIAPENVVSGTWRPSAKRLLRWSEDGKIRLHAGDDPLRPASPSRVLGESTLPWPHVGFYPARHFGQVTSQEPAALANIAFLADLQYRRYQQPVLCVCATRPRTRHLAEQIARRFGAMEPLPQPIRRITDLIDDRYRYLRPLRDALVRGVAYHNSSLPHDVREAIERAVGERALKVVAATTTLAEGVDLPFRVTILADWLVYDGEHTRPMDSLLFKNIAGRCGRAGQFTEGDTVIFDNPVGDATLTTPARRPSLQYEVFFNSSHPALRSAIGVVERTAARGAVGSQLLAAISENPGVDDLTERFFEMGFASRSDREGEVRGRIREAFREILDPTEEPLAVAASPTRLTPFGEAANATGLSPDTARRLRALLRDVPRVVPDRTALVEIGSEFLRRLGTAPEQTNADLRKATENPKSRPVVRLTELRLVLDLWLTGAPLEAIFAALPSNEKSTRRPGLQAWLAGVPEDSTWTDQFARFYDFITNCLQHFLPWTLRAAESIGQLDSQIELPWWEWAGFVEKGVDSEWGVRLLTEGATEERTIAAPIGRSLDLLNQRMELQTYATIERVVEAAHAGMEGDRRREAELKSILEWFRARL